MALSDKNIVITPNIGQTADPKIVFSGADGSTGANNITLTAYPTNSGTLSFDGSAGQLFSITNNLTGTLFSVNDISGIPSIEVIDTGLVRLTQYSGRVLLGTGTDNASDKLQVVGNIGATGSIAATNNIRAGTITVGTGATGATGSITASGAISATSGSITTGATGYVGATGSIGAPTGYFNNLFLNGTALSTSGGGTAFATTSLQVTDTNGATGATGSLTVSGNVMIGTTTPSTKLTVYDGATGAIVSTIGDGVGSNFRASRYSNDAIGANNAVIKYRGTFASPLAVASADSTGQFNFNAWGGTTIRTVAQMAGFVDTYTSDTNISGYLTLSTSPSGSAAAIERMRIDAAGGVNAANYLAVGTLTGATGATGSITSTTLVVNPTGATGATGAILAIGTTAARDLAGAGGGAYGSPELAIESTRIYTTASIIGYSTTGGPTLSMGKSRSGTLGTVTATQSGDFLGGISFDGVNTTPQFANAANILVNQDGAAGATWIPGRLQFQTSSGSGNPIERMRITSDGTVIIGNGETSANPTAGLLKATDGSGTNIAGASLTLHGGRGTGTGAGGALIFQTAPTGTSGSAINAGVERMRITTAGDVGIGTASPTSGYKLDVAGNFKVSGSIDENVFAVVDGAGVALSPRNGTIQTWTLGASRTPTAGTWEAGESMTLMINDSASSFTVTWTSLPVTWVGGAAPTLAPASGFTIIQLWKVSTTIYGALVGQTA